MLRRASLLAALALTGCGSVAAADLPAPAGPPQSPPLTVEPAGRHGSSEFGVSEAELTRTGRQRTCRDAIGTVELSRGARFAVLCGRSRVVELYDAKTFERLGSVPAGIGPTAIASDLVDIFYVVDSVGEALLVYHQKPLEPLRRVHLGGGPYAIAFDRERWGLWITLNARNQVVNYAAGIRPVLRDTLPSLRDARRVSVGDDTLTVVNDRRDVQRVRLRSR
jgi:hypothetical protein